MKAWQVLGAAAGIAGSANAFFRMECHHQTGYGRMDPIVDTGEISAHVHAFTGSNGKFMRFRSLSRARTLIDATPQV